ncbi:MAG: formyltransferase family protein [bacterium]|nr:formyltransferase family protein [bacterium]
MPDPLRLALLISGSGSTAAAIIAACADGGPLYGKIKPALLVSSAPDAGGIGKAVSGGIPTRDVAIIMPGKSPEQFGEKLLQALQGHAIDLIGQYGWMPKTPPAVVAAYHHRAINQHCGPLDPGRPDFGGQGMYGLRVHCARLYFARTIGRNLWTEATAQLVAAEFDAGPVLHRESLEILADDTPLSLRDRLLPVEHQIQIETLARYADGLRAPLPRITPLVLPQEQPVLRDAKRVARLLFPHG